jgi:menaquinone-dependent protoporphyrinogen IX oxidase
MKKVLVAFQSKYGNTRKYAEWIAEALGADLKERQDVTPDTLREYECVIYGGSLYAGGILGADLAAKNPCNNLIVFTVGLADPATTDYSRILEKDFPDGSNKPIRVFHLRGGIDYKKLNFVHKGMMAMMKKMTIGKKTGAELSSEEQVFSDTYGGKVDFTDKASIAPLVNCVLAAIDK